ncbi:hypothetical protein ARMA_1959 [Ardenticatena maritima]|uniref:G domain-containing protein n=1 Tax=Ardenticatena maritima TaxID=872965 RepID=A0A0M8KAC2_9CHLR|nr:dynamin family protein [Ardenticatena maritima]KPL89727.1 hypothetical protein SE16_00445 [Ardenticatena maritima]GAP63536.1 hypothetical protein ARMA_1959 [Ardenticatena maritima]
MHTLNERYATLLKQERRLLQHLLATLSTWDVPEEHMQRLHEALEHLDDFFLLVIVGEFNSGKSALINALLGERYVTEGVTPTTAHIHILRYGLQQEPHRTEEGYWVVTYPAGFLREIHIVDTPGTNAVLREHEAISRDFVPRSDLVLFVTSADRPFTESERDFLQTIRDWGKKIVFVINKIDLLEEEDARATVVEFVRENASRLLGTTPTIFAVSARQALKAKQSGAPVPPEWAALETYLFETLSAEERVRLKLASPLGVAKRILAETLERLHEREALLAEDLATIEQVETQLRLYRQDMEQEFDYHRLKIQAILNEMQARGETFFDETLRIARIFSLLNASALRQAFERDVIADTPQQIERQVQDLIDWMVDREARQWRVMARLLGERRATEHLEGAAQEAASGFEYNRAHLLDRVGRAAQDVLARYDRSAEARMLVENVQSALAQVALTEAGAIGLGTILTALLTTSAADLTGLLAAGTLGMLGLGIIPYRRRQAQKAFREKIEHLKVQLVRVLEEAFAHEIERSVKRLNEAIAPYARFVRTEQEHLQQLAATLHEYEAELRRLEAEIGTPTIP